MRNCKIAIVYDWFDKWGGVERILLTLHEIFPQAVFFTSYHDKAKTPWFYDFKVKSSFIQDFPQFIKKSRILSLPLYPLAFESFDFSQYDLVLSVSSSFAKSVITKPATLHISYLLTPTRYFWIDPEEYFKSYSLPAYTNYFLKLGKRWDLVASNRPDYYISISKTVSKRIKKYYNQDSQVIYPPFDIQYWKKIGSKLKTQKSKPRFKIQNFFLIVSRLEPYKKVDLAIEVFNKLGLKLVIVGKGSQTTKLKSVANSNCLFLQDLTDEQLASLYNSAEALIMPQEEDFGLVALESQFFGCPVISFRAGGATETIIDRKTGIFFEKQSVDSLSRTIENFDLMHYTLRKSTKFWGIKQAEKFSKNKFLSNLRNLNFLKNLKIAL